MYLPCPQLCINSFLFSKRSACLEDDFDDLVEDYEFIGGATVFVSDGNVGLSGQVSAGVKKSSIMRDDRRTALVECLKSIDDSPAVVLSFADEILLRYKIAAIGNNFEQGSCTKSKYCIFYFLSNNLLSLDATVE